MIKDIFKVELYKVKLNNIDNEKIVDYINNKVNITYDPKVRNRNKDEKPLALIIEAKKYEIEFIIINNA